MSTRAKQRGIQYLFGRYPNHLINSKSNKLPSRLICNPQLIYASHVVFPQKYGGVQKGGVSIDQYGIIDAVYPSITSIEAKNISTSRNISYTNLGETNATLSPGLIDVHCHISELGREWEGYESATRAAASGGLTTLMGMPLNSIPATTTVHAFEQELKAAEVAKLYADVGLWGGIVPSNISDDLDALKEMMNVGVFGFKAFLAPLPPAAGYETVTPEQLKRAALLIGEERLPILVHSELMTQEEQDLQMEKSYEGMSHGSYEAHVKSRPGVWEHHAVEVVCYLAKDCHMHIVHLSDAGCLDIIEKTKQELRSRSKADDNERGGLTVETCPHYLLFDLESLVDGDTRYKCFPPIRDKKNQEQLWHRGLLRRKDNLTLIDMIASDHSPCTPDLRLQESGNLKKAWGGLTGLQYQLPASYTALEQYLNNSSTDGNNEREMSDEEVRLELMAKWWSEEPSKLVPGLDKIKGKIDVGYVADLCAWDSNFEGRPNDYCEEHHRWKSDGVYADKILRGRVMATFLRGIRVYDGDTDSFPEDSQSAGSIMISR